MTTLPSTVSTVNSQTLTNNNITTQPNIVFILADDMGYGDLGCYNPDSKIPTPNMDNLASQGMRFTDAHSPSAVCSPTRYGVLTGRYAWRSRLKNGVLWGYSTSLIEKGRTTVASMLKQRGYTTGCVGKWHLGFQNGDPVNRKNQVDYNKLLQPGPITLGFDYFYGIPASLDMDPYIFIENDRPVESATEMIEDSAHRRQNGGGFWRGGPIAPNFKHVDVLPIITQKSVEFIQKNAKETPENPFFLYFPLTAPHTPWIPTKDFLGKSDAGYYGDFTTQVDWSVGQIMDTLKQHNLTENTLIIITSDNGSHWYQNDIEQFDHRSNLHLRGQKADIWEGGHRIPFIARWPKHIEASTINDQTICLTDLMATIGEILDEDLPENAGEDSISILPTLINHQLDLPIRDTIINHSANGTFAIRQGAWKLIQGLGSGGFSSPQTVEPSLDGPTGQLYNLDDDPSETNNLYLEQPECVEQLTKLLDTYQDQGYSRNYFSP